MKINPVFTFILVGWIIFVLTDTNFPSTINNSTTFKKDSSITIINNTESDSSGNSWFYENSASLIGSFITIIGFLIAFYQLRRNAKTLQGDLALRLDERMNHNRDIYKELFEGGKYYYEIPEDKIVDIEYYLTFYDTTAMLVQNKQIYLDQINKLYGFRFTCLMHNPAVHMIIKRRINSWKGLIWLYQELLKERIKNEEEIDRPKNKFKVE